jgi:hypothetical protein
MPIVMCFDLFETERYNWLDTEKIILFSGGNYMNVKKVIIAGTVSLMLALLVVWIWVGEHNSYTPNVNELNDHLAVINHLDDYDVNADNTDISSVGIYIDSLSFETSNDVGLSGYIWQTLDKDMLDDENFGIVFPESIGGTSMEERYRQEDEDSITVGWYFETVVRQQFNYAKYPIDHKTVWLRMIPADFSSLMVLVPDLDSYDKTGYEDTFGISSEIVLTGWSLTETFYDFHSHTYDTNFGLGEDHARKKFPEMSFNVVVERDFLQAIIVNLTLMLVIMALLYSLVLMVTTEEDKLMGRFGMSASGAIGTTSALFFAVLLAHIDLRNMFAGQFVYLELFYYVAYLFILCISVLVFVFMNELNNSKHAIVKNNAILFKLGYWPVYFGIIAIFTYFWM